MGGTDNAEVSPEPAVSSSNPLRDFDPTPGAGSR